MLLVAFYVSMALAAYAVGFGFGALHLTPTAPAGGRAVHMGFAWDYTTWLDLALLPLAGVLAWRFFTNGGPEMLREMAAPQRFDGDVGA